MNWSGGKDSALSLYHALKDPNLSVETLLTSVNDSFKRISMHGVREELLQQQAQNIGKPLVTLRLPETVSMEEYQQRMAETLNPLLEQGITHSIFGDIFWKTFANIEKNVWLSKALRVFFLFGKGIRWNC
jgi:diphthamide synthase (EF-2-diphthine--ammonia ligase)